MSFFNILSYIGTIMAVLADLKAAVDKIVADIDTHKANDSGKDAQIADLQAKLDAANADIVTIAAANTADAAARDAAVADAAKALTDADAKLVA